MMIAVIELQVHNVSRSPHFFYQLTNKNPQTTELRARADGTKTSLQFRLLTNLLNLKTKGLEQTTLACNLQKREVICTIDLAYGSEG